MEQFNGYNILDAVIAGIILLALILGAWKGFLRSLTALTGIVFGIILSARYYGLVQPYLHKVSSLDKHVSMVLSMIIVFVLVQVAFVLIRHALDRLLDLTKLTWLDRSLGALMGFSAGFLIAAALVQSLLIGLPEWPPVKKSQLAQPVNQLTGKAMEYAPANVRELLSSFVYKIKSMSEGTPSQKSTGPWQKPGSGPAK